MDKVMKDLQSQTFLQIIKNLDWKHDYAFLTSFFPLKYFPCLNKYFTIKRNFSKWIFFWKKKMSSQLAKKNHFPFFY